MPRGWQPPRSPTSPEQAIVHFISTRCFNHFSVLWQAHCAGSKRVAQTVRALGLDP
jgi:hypothetical protein